MSDVDDDLLLIEESEPLAREDAAEVAPRDSEIDFDDEPGDDRLRSTRSSRRAGRPVLAGHQQDVFSHVLRRARLVASL